MTDEELSPEQAAEMQEAMAIHQLMRTPVRLPTVSNVVPLDGGGGEPAILIETMTPAGTQRLVLTRDEALAFAARIRKAAQTGPSLVVPPAAGKLVVPG